MGQIPVNLWELLGGDLPLPVPTGTRIPDPPFSSFGPSRDYGMDLCLEVYLLLLCYFVTLLFCPLHQSGKDLSLLLKLSKVGALTTADGKSFQ